MRTRELPPVMESHTASCGVRPCFVMTGVDVSTVQLPEGHFACVTLSRPDLPGGCLVVLDREEVEAIVRVMLHAMEDADLLDAGQPPIHTTGEVARTHH